MGRRRFLETLAGMGLSAEAVSYMTKDQLESLTGDPTDEVPRLGSLYLSNAEGYKEPPYPNKPGEREPEYYTIPHDKWVTVETAFDAAQRVQEMINQFDDTGLVSAGVSITNKNHVEEYGVNVTRTIQATPNPQNNERGPKMTKEDLTPSVASETVNTRTPDVSLDELQGELPETASGTVGDENTAGLSLDNIPIEFNESIEWEEECGEEPCSMTDNYDEWFFQSQYRYYEGHDYISGTGCHINVDPSGYDGSLSLGPRVQPTTGGEPMFLTAAHGTFENDPNDALGRNVYQGGTSDYHKIGYIYQVKNFDDEDTNAPMDAALIRMNRPSGNIHAGNKLASEDGPNQFSNQLASNRVGKDYLKDGMGRVCKQGYRTGRCEHSIHEFIESSYRADEIVLRRENEDGSGNSGCPYFVDQNGQLQVAGLHRAGDTVYETTDRGWYSFEVARGLWIGDIEDAFDVTVV